MEGLVPEEGGLLSGVATPHLSIRLPLCVSGERLTLCAAVADQLVPAPRATWDLYSPDGTTTFNFKLMPYISNTGANSCVRVRLHELRHNSVTYLEERQRHAGSLKNG